MVYLIYKFFSGGNTMSRRGENIFKRKDGRWEGRYISGYADGGRAKYSSVYAYSYVECSQKLTLAKADRLPPKDPVTVNELFEVWLASRKNSIKPSSYVSYRTCYQNYICDYFGELTVGNISSFMINQYVSALLECGKEDGGGLSATTVQVILILMKSVFAYGETEYELKNPAKNILLPKSEHKEIEVFSDEEIERIRANALCGDCKTLGILLCLYSGLRIGELCALRWENIDLENQTIYVRKTLQRIKNPDSDLPKTVVMIDDPKSARSIRDIPIPTFMLGKLAEFRKSAAANFYFLTGSAKFTEPRTYQNRYKSFLKEIGVPYKNFHVLRHTFATECIRHGIDVKTVSDLLGHASVKITLERYVHSDMDMKRRQLEKLFDGV